MKVIMIPVADRPECRVAIDAAFALADRLSGNVIGCHLRPHRFEGSSRAPRRRVGSRNSGLVAPGVAEKEMALRSKAAEELFGVRAAAVGFRPVKRATLGISRAAQWIEMVGSLDRLFSIVGPTSDVSIVSRPKQTAKGVGAEFMLSALLDSGKPVIVLPQTRVSSLGKRVLIAWNQSVEAARTVSSSLPLLQKAEAVTIVSCGSESRVGPKAAAVVNYLKYWNVKADSTRTRGRDAAAEIFDVYRKEGSDLIVMGAYSRSRLRERVFGGVTEDLLFRSGPPIFTMHS